MLLVKNKKVSLNQEFSMNAKYFQIFKTNYFQLIFGCCLVLAFSFTSCKKDKFDTSSGISFSTDTLTFDTLFTTLGSTTKFFIVRNTQKQPIKISSIKLAGGAASSYRINVDGDAGVSFTDIEIPAKDSIYIFAEVTVDPNAADLPFIIEDSIQFTTNGKLQQVQLNAYGQNANFFDAATITTDTTWTNNKPYVIMNFLQIANTACLNIEKGCKIYFGGGAAMIVEGCLNINGIDTTDAVVFRGVRLDKDVADRPYDNFPGQYAGLFFLRGSTGNINYLNMRNSAYGINIGNIKTTDDEAQNVQQILNMSISNAPNITLTNSKIYNSAFYGIFGFLGRLEASNVLVYNCGKSNIALIDGGDYKFINCTFYNRGSSYTSHTKEPVLYFNNYFKYSELSPAHQADSSLAYFSNCIIYGTLDEEIVLESITGNPHKLNTLISHSIVKTQRSLDFPVFDAPKIEDPQFVDVFKFNYKLKSTSPAIDFSEAPATSVDIDKYSITGSKRDCGAYEFH